MRAWNNEGNRLFCENPTIAPCNQPEEDATAGRGAIEMTWVFGGRVEISSVNKRRRVGVVQSLLPTLQFSAGPCIGMTLPKDLARDTPSRRRVCWSHSPKTAEEKGPF